MSQVEIMRMMDRVKDLLSERGLNQRELAEQIDVTEISVSRWCSGTREPKVGNLARIAKFLNVSVDYLIFGTDSVDQNFDT